MNRKLSRWYMPMVFVALIFTTTMLQGSTVAQEFWNADKLLHVALYGGLAVIVAMALQRPGRPLSWKMALLAAFISVAYSALEEYHQTFIPGRVACTADLTANTVGAFLGAGWYLVFARRWPGMSLVLGE